MGQLHGQIVTDNDERVGVVQSVGSAVLNQPDVVLRDAATGVEVDRTPRPQLPVETINVKWEDGTTSTLTECIDAWTVLGSISAFPEIKDVSAPPAGALGELPEQLAVTEAVDVVAYAEKLRAAAPIAAATRASERALVLEDDGVLSIAE